MKEQIFGFGSEHFDALKVLALGSPPFGKRTTTLATGTHWRFPILRERLCTAEQSKRLVELWNQLPTGEVARCHVPGFAFQLMLGEEPVFTAALCWQCNNVSFAGRLATVQSRAFEASSDMAKQMLSLCQEVAGHDG